jgi:hypothetical protein
VGVAVHSLWMAQGAAFPVVVSLPPSDATAPGAPCFLSQSQLGASRKGYECGSQQLSAVILYEGERLHLLVLEVDFEFGFFGLYSPVLHQTASPLHTPPADPAFSQLLSHTI